MRRRFFVDHFSAGSAVLEGDAAHHLGNVLRAESGQLYELSDGSSVWLARIASAARSRVEFALLEELPAPPPAPEVTLLLSIIKFDAFEWALEKATELGVSRIVPLAASRSEKNLVRAAAKRAERWRKILFESGQQSRRLALPQLVDACRPAQAFGAPAQEGNCRILLSERSDAPTLRSVFSATRDAPPHGFTLATGPEGGWADEELVAARGAGFLEASLGPLILRAETAVISALAIVNFVLSAAS